MELNNEFRVGISPSEAWTVLTDVERIAPCMPGAQLQEVAGDEYRGVVKVKVGPITAQYKGKATFVDRDQAAGRVVLRAEGRDTRGQGNANATITATLVADGGGTKVTVLTDLTVTGKVAQFGRGVLAEVSAKLLNQFVECLESDVLASAPAPAPAPVRGGEAAAAVTTPAAVAPATVAESGSPTATAATEIPSGGAPVVSGSNGSGPQAAARPTVRQIDHPEAAPVDLLDAAGGSIARRAVPVAAGVVILVVVVVWRRRRRAARGLR